MSDANDTRAAQNLLQTVESASNTPPDTLLRNFADRIGMDGSRDFSALRYIAGIAASLSIPLPDKQAIYHGNAIAAGETVVKCLPGIRLVIFDIFVSLNAVCNIDFVDANGNYLWATMYGPNNGQGFTAHFPKGIWLPTGQPLAHNASAAVAYSIAVNYAEIER